MHRCMKRRREYFGISTLDMLKAALMRNYCHKSYGECQMDFITVLKALGTEMIVAGGSFTR